MMDGNTLKQHPAVMMMMDISKMNFTSGWNLPSVLSFQTVTGLLKLKLLICKVYHNIQIHHIQ